MDTQPQKTLSAKEKLTKKFGNPQLGGKGTARRKNKRVTKTTGGDVKFRAMLKKLGADPIPDITEVNMFTEDDKVLRFKNPEVQGSLQNQTLVITGEPQTQELKDCFTEIMAQLGPEQLGKLKDLGAKTETIKEENEDDDDEVPDLVGDVNLNQDGAEVKQE